MELPNPWGRRGYNGPFSYLESNQKIVVRKKDKSILKMYCRGTLMKFVTCSRRVLTGMRIDDRVDTVVGDISKRV